MGHLRYGHLTYGSKKQFEHWAFNGSSSNVSKMLCLYLLVANVAISQWPTPCRWKSANPSLHCYSKLPYHDLDLVGGEAITTGLFSLLQQFARFVEIRSLIV